MSFLPIALLITAIANVIYKTVELQRHRALECTWTAAVIVAAIVIELVEYLSKTSRFGNHIPHLEVRLWIPRLILIMTLAVLRVDADVVRSATDSYHRECFGLSVKQEQATLNGIQIAWLSDPSISSEAYLRVIEREKALANSLQYIDSALSVEDLAKGLDTANVPTLSAYGPVGGYEAITTMKIQIGYEQHLREWSSHGFDLCVQLFWLLLPYVMGSIAFCAFEKRGPRSIQRQVHHA